MPDGDVVHNKLTKPYQKPYKWLCEGKATSEECARILLEKLKHDIRSNGDLPVILAQSMANSLIQAMSTTNELESEEYAALSMDFETITQQCDGSPVVKELSLGAGKRLLRDLKYGQVTNADNPSVMILERYMNEVYESLFKERIPLRRQALAS
ncbi:hypothetical protein IQ250_12560 [Pseudanabaenaceae cyanobacterium LEGE 13415]|nr:hypothetical protein [Pseudanabaenaceae cyanobacterium LEGE 13415]